MSELLRQLPSDSSTVTEATREANRRIAEKAQRLRFNARIPFICECGDPDCREFVLLYAEEYGAACRDGAAVALRGHAAADEAERAS